MGKMMEQGPVLIITFQAQLVMVIRNTKGEVVEGDPVSETRKHIYSLLYYLFIDLSFVGSKEPIKGQIVLNYVRFITFTSAQTMTLYFN